jgi:hypothetical protein
MNEQQLEITSCFQLLEEWMGRGLVTNEYYAENFIGRQLSKSTICGVSFRTDTYGIYISGYAEGSEADLPEHNLRWGEFTLDDFNDTVTDADAEGVEEWNAAQDMIADGEDF